MPSCMAIVTLIKILWPHQVRASSPMKNPSNALVGTLMEWIDGILVQPRTTTASIECTYTKKSDRIVDTVELFPAKAAMTRTESKDMATIAAQELTHALMHPAPAAPFSAIGGAQLEALRQLAIIFDAAILQSATGSSVPVPSTDTNNAPSNPFRAPPPRPGMYNYTRPGAPCNIPYTRSSACGPSLGALSNYRPTSCSISEGGPYPGPSTKGAPVPGPIPEGEPYPGAFSEGGPHSGPTSHAGHPKPLSTTSSVPNGACLRTTWSLPTWSWYTRHQSLWRFCG
jgi:hypothetical protein